MLACAILVGCLALSQPERPDRPRIDNPPPERGPRQADGPWNHKIHFATSDDGIAFDERAEPVMLKASVPDIIELGKDLPKGSGPGTSKGHLSIYAVDGRDKNASGLIRLTSTDAGKTWSQPEAVLFGGKGMNGNPVDPAVVQLEDGRLRMYVYQMKPRTPPPGPLRPGDRPPGLPEPLQIPPKPLPRTIVPDFPKKLDPVIPRAPEPARDGSHGVYSAVSDDGLAFTYEDGVRLEESGITDPEVVRTGGQWLMFLSRGQEVLLARSSDGLAFERDKTFILRGGGVPGAVVLPDGRVRIFQSAREGIVSSVFDPKNGVLTADEGVRVKGPCADPAVWPRAGGGFVAVVKRFIDAPDRGPARYGRD